MKSAIHYKISGGLVKKMKIACGIDTTGHYTTDWNKVTCPYCLKKKK